MAGAYCSGLTANDHGVGLTPWFFPFPGAELKRRRSIYKAHAPKRLWIDGEPGRPMSAFPLDRSRGDRKIVQHDTAATEAYGLPPT